MENRRGERLTKTEDDRNRGRNPIRRVVLSRTKVPSGESISVIVRTNPGSKGKHPVVRVNGAAGAQQFVQLSGPPGSRRLTISAVSGNVTDVHHFDVEVLEADPYSPAPVIEVYGDPSQEATASARVANADDVHMPGAYYEWHYGARSPIVTREPSATLRFADFLDPNERFKVFHLELVVRYPNQSLRKAKRSVTVWNRYALAKERGIVQPRVDYQFKASPEGEHLVGRARIINLDSEQIHFTHQQIQWLLNVPDATAEPSRPTNISVMVPPHSSFDIEHKVLLGSLPADAFGFAVILRGTTQTGLAAHAAAYFEYHTPRANKLRVITDPALLQVIQALRTEDCGGSRRRITRDDMENFARKQESREGTSLSAKIGMLFGESTQALNGSFEDEECLPDQTPPEEGLACQLTDEWGWVAVPGRFVNARKGDVLLSPGSGGPILGVLRHVSPAQIFSHSALMIENYYKLRHSTASEEWLQDQASDSFTTEGSDGLQPEALQYIWPGTITQTAENAMQGESFTDPNHKTDHFGALKTYTLAAMTNGGLDPGQEIIDPLIVKPDPLIEAQHEWVRANLHRVANAAQEIRGHYRFFAYTDAQICGEETGPFVAPTRPGWWASETRPTVCSSMIWAAAASLSNPVVRLEGTGPFTQSSDIEPTDIGADVDFMTRDGLYFYTEEERKVAGQWLYSYFYNVAYQIAGAGGVLVTDAASDLGNQICNTFAFDWVGWSDVENDESKDSDRWVNPGVGRAVSPDNIMNWDKPTVFDGEIVHGLYGFTEPLVYRQPYLEYRQISRWKRVPTTGNLLGKVRYQGNGVGSAIVNVGGQSLLSNAAGDFSVELSSGSYHVQAGKLINGGYAEGDAHATVVAGQDAHTVVDLRDPPELSRRLTIRGTMQIRDYEEFGDNEHATRLFARHSDVGPYGTHDEIHWTETMGGEIRVEVILKIDWRIDLSIDLNWNVKFFEGTSEETTDLDGERSGTATVLKDGGETLSISIWNDDEEEPQDRANIILDLTNSVRP